MRPGQFASPPLGWWEIAYAGGSVVRGSTLAEWNAAPGIGVLVVRQPVQRTYKRRDRWVHFTIRIAQVDYYWLDDDGLVAGGNIVPLAANPLTVKQGSWASREEYVAAYNAFYPDVPVEV